MIAYKGVISWQCRIWGLVSRVRQENKSDKVDQNISEQDLKNWEYKINETRNHIVNHVNIFFIGSIIFLKLRSISN